MKWHRDVAGGERPRTYPKPVSNSKYRNKRCVVGGYEFHSIAEGRRYAELMHMHERGLISKPELQPEYPMIVNGTKIGTYRADFRYTYDGNLHVEDVKGFKTAVYRLKRRIVEAQYGIRIIEISPRRGVVPNHLLKWFRLQGVPDSGTPVAAGSDPSDEAADRR